jgi:dihydroorotase-like cyclic amidohydrolase
MDCRDGKDAVTGKNTPYAGQQFKGMVVATIHNGVISYKDDSIRII